jgi:hypothetical protein
MHHIAHPRRPGGRLLGRVTVAGAVLGGAFGLAAAMSSSAGASPLPATARAGTLPADYAEFADCPLDVKAVSACVTIQSTSLDLAAGSFDLSTTLPVTLTFGLVNKRSGVVVVPPDNGALLLQSPPIPVPGGLTHIPPLDFWPLAADLQPELVGLPVLSIPDFITGKGVALKLSIVGNIENPITNVLSALGPGCDIGTTADPITLNLTTGTTSPPAPNQPITGNTGTTVLPQPARDVLERAGVVAVDNSYSVPGASGCGATPFGDTLDWAVNLDGSLPAASGTNTANLAASFYEVPASVLRAAEAHNT